MSNPAKICHKQIGSSFFRLYCLWIFSKISVGDGGLSRICVLWLPSEVTGGAGHKSCSAQTPRQIISKPPTLGENTHPYLQKRQTTIIKQNIAKDTKIMTKKAIFEAQGTGGSRVELVLKSACASPLFKPMACAWSWAACASQRLRCSAAKLCSTLPWWSPERCWAPLDSLGKAAQYAFFDLKLLFNLTLLYIHLIYIILYLMS